MSPPATSSEKSTVAKYKSHIDGLMDHGSRFAPLKVFLSTANPTESRIHVVKFGGAFPDTDEVTENDFEKTIENSLKNPSLSTLFIVEDISPHTLAVLGQHWNPDPQFFLDYLDVARPTESTPNRSKIGSNPLVPIPWFRFGDVENHLPSLRSMQDNSSYVRIRFIGPREYKPVASTSKVKHESITERLDAPTNPGNVARVGGGHIPIHVEGQRLWEISMNRYSASAWFDSGTNWTKGIILLDPPLDYSQQNLIRENSKYRSFIPENKLHKPSTVNRDTRHSYSTSFQHYLRMNDKLTSSAPSPVLILQDLFRIIASEWIVVNVYIERDLNAIEWRLQKAQDDVFLLTLFLERLFILRRRTGKYQTLVEDYLNPRFPPAWLTSAPADVQQDMKSDFQQVRDMLHRNHERISQTIPLVTSLMSVIEAKHATSISQRLAFLTVLATVALPFSVYASIFGMQTDFGPGEKLFWVFLTVAGVTIGIVSGCYLKFLRILRVRDEKVRASLTSS